MELHPTEGLLLRSRVTLLCVAPLPHPRPTPPTLSHTHLRLIQQHIHSKRRQQVAVCVVHRRALLGALQMGTWGDG